MACAVTTVPCRTQILSCHGACSVPDLATVKNVTQDWKKCGDTQLCSQCSLLVHSLGIWVQNAPVEVSARQWQISRALTHGLLRCMSQHHFL